MTLLLEHWKPIVGYEGLYEISNTGRVWSCRAQRQLKTYTRRGYIRICLYRHGPQRHFFVHCLIAAAFIGPKLPGMTVNHMNGFKLTNRPSNFEYVTSQENTRHAVANGLSNRGSRHGLAKLTEDRVRLMRNDPSAHSSKEWADIFGCHVSNIERAISRKSWKHI